MLANSPQNAPSPFEGLPANHFKAILADPPWRFKTWNNETAVKSHKSRTSWKESSVHYTTMTLREIARLPVECLAADDCCLFMWVTWPMMQEALDVIKQWGFSYKTCAFDWVKADASQMEFFRDDTDGRMGMGYWTRANSEPCLLATKGKPKRISAAVRQAIVEPRREHSRKPDCVYDRIERLVDGPYVELFARQSTRPAWSFWGQEATKFNEARGVPS